MKDLLAHLVGDYCLQNHWMATQKTSRWSVAFVHAFFYGLPFLLLCHAWWQWVVIVGTHAVIDRLRLATYWTGFWGIGKMTDESPWFNHVDYVEPAPPFLTVWLTIIVDNTMHLTINYITLSF